MDRSSRDVVESDRSSGQLFRSLSSALVRILEGDQTDTALDPAVVGNECVLGCGAAVVGNSEVYPAASYGCMSMEK